MTCVGSRMGVGGGGGVDCNVFVFGVHLRVNERPAATRRHRPVL